MEIGLIKKDNKFEIEILSLKVLNGKIKTINGSQYNTEKKRWEIPEDSIDSLKEAVKDIATVKIMEGKVGSVKVRVFTDMVLSVIQQFHPDVIPVYKSIPGKQYDPETKVWTFPLEQANRLIKSLQAVKNLNVIVN